MEQKVPKDIICHLSKITAIGRNEVYIENFRSLSDYEENCIEVQTKAGKIRICGKKLSMEYFGHCELLINGKIEKIEFL